MVKESKSPVRQVADAVVESEKSYWKDAGRLGLIGAGIGFIVGGGAGFYVLGVTGFIIGAAAGTLIGGVGLVLFYMLA